MFISQNKHNFTTLHTHTVAHENEISEVALPGEQTEGKNSDFTKPMIVVGRRFGWRAADFLLLVWLVFTFHANSHFRRTELWIYFWTQLCWHVMNFVNAAGSVVCIARFCWTLNGTVDRWQMQWKKSYEGQVTL